MRVKSSMIKRYGYDPRTYTLTVQFQNDSIYKYFNVRPHDLKMVVTAPSVGKAFNAIIKPQYNYKRIV